MKSIKLSTEKIVKAHRIIDAAKYQKLSDEDKVRLWKISRKLCPIASGFQQECTDAQKKLLPYEGFADDIQKAIQYESIKAGKAEGELPMKEDEYVRIAGEFQKYNSLLKQALKELEEKEETLEFEPLSEESFGKLMASNDWTLSQVSELDFIIE